MPARGIQLNLTSHTSPPFGTALSLTFADGTTDELDVVDRMHGPVFAEARTPEGFQRVSIDHETGKCPERRTEAAHLLNRANSPQTADFSATPIVVSPVRVRVSPSDAQAVSGGSRNPRVIAGCWGFPYLTSGIR